MSGDSRLLRVIGRWDLTALVINAIIGAGIFGLPSKVFALVGVWSLILFVLCAALVFGVVLCFAEVGSRFQETGGPYLYIRSAFGPWFGFGAGWLVWLSRVSSFAALTNLLVTYLGWFAPWLESGLPRALLCFLLITILAAINIAGVRASTRVGNAFTIGKLAPLLLFAAFGLLTIEPGRFVLGPPPRLGDAAQAALLLAFAFTGFESAIIPGGEMLDPKRHLPAALITAVATVTLVYLGVQAVCIGTLAELAHSPRPLAESAQTFAGHWGAALIVVGASVSIVGNINTTMLAAPRVLFAMAERAQMPAALASVHPSFQTPHRAIAFTALVMLAATLTGGFVALVLVSTISRLLVYVGTCAAVLALRRSDGAEAAHFRVPGGAAVPLVALVLCGALLATSTWQEAAVVAAALVLGVVPYALFGSRHG